MTPDASLSPLPQAPPPFLSPEERALWCRLSRLGAGLRDADAPALGLLCQEIVLAARVRRALGEKGFGREGAKALLDLLASAQGSASALLRKLRLPPLHLLGVG